MLRQTTLTAAMTGTKRKESDEPSSFDISTQMLLKRCRETADMDGDNNGSRGQWCGLLPALGLAFRLCERPRRQSSRLCHSTASCELGKLVERQLGETIGKQPLTPTTGEPRHRVTAWLLEYFAERQWTLLDAQVPLNDKLAGVRTWIDFVAYDHVARKYVLIELKVGFDAGYNARLVPEHDYVAGIGRKPPPAKLPLIDKYDSYETRHILQSCWMDWAFGELCSVPRSRFYSCIVRASNNGNVRVHEPRLLPEWALTLRDTIAQRVRAYARYSVAPLYADVYI